MATLLCAPPFLASKLASNALSDGVPQRSIISQRIFRGVSMKMWIRFSTACLLLGVSLLGCSRDPNVAKQKYLQSGMQFFQANKYREAALQVQSTIQID